METAQSRDPHIAADHRVPALDGIRGLALLLVAGHHLLILYPMAFRGTPPWWFPIAHFFDQWGWAGVDLFFALSGYLITGILLDNLDTSNYFRSFYARRTLRIFPAYYAMLVLFLGIVYVVPQSVVSFTRWGLPQRQWPYWLYLSNYLDFFNLKVYHPLGHIWSLAVEEQFYLIWPTLIYFVRGRWSVVLCLVLIIASYGARSLLFKLGFDQNQVHRAAFTRFDTLAAGALVATLLRWPSVRKNLCAICWTLLILTFAGLWIDSRFGSLEPNFGTSGRVSAGYTIIAFFAASLVGVVATSPPRAIINLILSLPPLRWLGRYSYGLYLYHYPVLLVVFVVRQYYFTPAGIAMRFVVFPGCTVALAMLSWYLLERPMLRLKRHFPSRDTHLLHPCQN